MVVITGLGQLHMEGRTSIRHPVCRNAVAPLCDLIREKTAGNPFFTTKPDVSGDRAATRLDLPVGLSDCRCWCSLGAKADWPSRIRERHLCPRLERPQRGLTR